MSDSKTATDLLSVGDILWNEPCDERIVVIAANERNVWLRKVQKNDELAMHDGHVWAMLGKKCNAKNMCTQSYAQSVFELDGRVEQAIAATLGNSRAERTCHIEWRDDSYDTDAGYERDGAYFCTACRAELPYPLQECWDDYQAGNYEKPFNYCPNCGARVVE